ncbi:hypothetical protein SBADM41S_12303 [Streptomyces badius]
MWAATAAAGAVLHLIAPSDRSTGSALLLPILGAVVRIGAAVRERGEATRRLAEQETISEAERAQRTLLEERTRIARELHDVVAHHMSVITVQADSAPYRISVSRSPRGRSSPPCGGGAGVAGRDAAAAVGAGGAGDAGA